MPCDLEKEDLSAHMDNELSGERKAYIDAHLLECAECADERAFLEGGNRAVESLVEYGTPRAFETELRRIVLTSRPERLRWWSLGGRLKKRHIVAILCAVCGVCLLVLAGRLSVLLLEYSSESVPEPVVEKPISTVESPPQATGTVPAKVVKPEAKPVQPAADQPPPPPPPSPYEGWWMITVGRPVEYQYPVHIRQRAGRLAMYAWGSETSLGAGIETDGKLAFAGADGLSFEIEFSPREPDFTGVIQREGGPTYSVFANRIGDRLADELAATRDLPAFIDRRLAVARKLSAALYSYARANGDRFPSALDELVPDYLQDDSAFAGSDGLETEYSRPGMIPADKVVDWASYDTEEFSGEERLLLLEEQDLGRFHAFFDEMVVHRHLEFPEGRVVIYLDGSVAWDGVDTVPSHLLPQEHSRIEGEKERTCAGRLQKLGQALLNFADDHDGLFPTRMQALLNFADDHDGLFPTRIEMLWPVYLKDAQNLCCPSRGPREVAYDIVCLGEQLPGADELELDPELFSTIPLAIETEDAHRDGFHMVTADRQVEWRPGYER